MKFLFYAASFAAMLLLSPVLTQAQDKCSPKKLMDALAVRDLKHAALLAKSVENPG